MAASTFAELQDDLATVIGSGARSGDPLRTQFKRWLNRSFRRIAYAYPWDEMRAWQTVTTAAPYTTGTVAVTNGSTTITFTGSTLVSGMALRKFSLGYGSPVYRIASVNPGAGTAVLADAYQEATNATATFVIFQDEYNLAAATHSIEEAHLIGADFTAPIVGVPAVRMNAADHGGSTASRPVAYSVTVSTTVGTPRIRFLTVPDDEYRVEFVYQKEWTDLSADADDYSTQGLPPDIEELAVDRALRWAPRLEGSRRVMSDVEWQRALAIVYANHHKRRYRSGSRRGISLGGRAAIVFNMSAIGT